MHDPQNRWDPDMPDDTQGSGLLWQTGRNMALLLVGCLLLAGVLTRQGEPDGPASEPVSEARQTPEQPAQHVARTTATGDEMVIPMGPNGHFMLDAVVDGVEIRFLVDTGATSVVLTEEDAKRLGYRPEFLEYNERFQTANGEIRGARIVLPDLRIGDLEVEDVRSSVIRAPMSTSLLGMSFLSRLEGYEVRDEGLVLRW